MIEMKVGDRVRVRGLVQSDCLGLTGTIIDVNPSAFLGRGVQRCRVDFNGKVRRILNVHLIHKTSPRVPNALTVV
jgi:hypothetical protein